MKIRRAFYKYPWKPLNFAIGLWTLPLNLFTPWYSHEEVGLFLDNEWIYFSSTLRGDAKGTRWITEKDLFKYPKRWDVYEKEVYGIDEIKKRIDLISDLPYDLKGLTAFLFVFGFLNDAEAWYCSEACYFVIFNVWKKTVSPRRSYAKDKKNLVKVI